MSSLQVKVQRVTGAVLVDMLQLPTFPPCTIQCVVVQHVCPDHQGCICDHVNCLEGNATDRQLPHIVSQAPPLQST